MEAISLCRDSFICAYAWEEREGKTDAKTCIESAVSLYDGVRYGD